MSQKKPVSGANRHKIALVSAAAWAGTQRPRPPATVLGRCYPGVTTAICRCVSHLDRINMGDTPAYRNTHAVTTPWLLAGRPDYGGNVKMCPLRGVHALVGCLRAEGSGMVRLCIVFRAAGLAASSWGLGWLASVSLVQAKPFLKRSFRPMKQWAHSAAVATTHPPIKCSPQRGFRSSCRASGRRPSPSVRTAGCS